MSDPSDRSEEAAYSCPVCDTRIAGAPAPPPFDAPCPDCGYMLWCRKKMMGGVAVLHVVPGRTPEHGEVEQLGEALERPGGGPRVIVELSALDFMSSAFIARLVALNKRIRAAGGKLVLCGLHPFVREAFHDSRLERIFEIADDEKAALASF